MAMRLTSTRLSFSPRSLVAAEGVEYGLAQTRHGRRLIVLAQPGTQTLDEFEGENSEFEGRVLLLCPLNHKNATALQKYIPWLQPKLLGLSTSAGMGDRLGIATPGHVRAVRDTQAKVAPIFAQQSIREMQRTNRTPQQVMEDAMWGAFEEGWQAGFGSDADHLKTTQDIDACLAVGFTLFTLDPGQYVVNNAYEVPRSQLKDQLPIAHHLTATGLLGKTIDVEGFKITFEEELLEKAIIKYGSALDHIATLYQHLEKHAENHPFEVEISMDETEQPTSPAEHVYIASELHRMGVKWVSFAPRFVGRFEKGVDYIGDLPTFDAQLAVHAAIARQLGPYKLSLHSGSDKFSIYPIFVHHTHGLAHLKTAGTSYLEALRTIATVDVKLFRAIYTFSCQHFNVDKVSYHISAELGNAPEPGEIRDWPGLLNQFDAREILHVTFGSVLTERAHNGNYLFYDRIIQILNLHREQYFDNLVKHFRRHLEPFSA